MCTVSFWARRDGYRLAMNRDELRLRPAALPPRPWTSGERRSVYPTEPSGGTWIGSDDSGTTLALLNWYAVDRRPSGEVVSRGTLIPALLGLGEPDAVLARLGRQPLARIPPFRLVGVFPGERVVAEWRWDLVRLSAFAFPWESRAWFSSGHDEPGAERVRGARFAAALVEEDAGSLRWLRRLHASHEPVPGPCSFCMHRDEACTVSYTEVVVAGRRLRMAYHPGSPCGMGPRRPGGTWIDLRHPPAGRPR